MIKLADGREHLYQWDTGRQIECDAEQVHFSNRHYGTSIDVDVKDGKATIPNQLLTSAIPLKAWAWVKDTSGEYTKEEQVLLVAKRNKPSDYVYTPAAGSGGGGGSTYYVELDGNYPNYTLSETTPLADIAAAYNEGKALFCRCTRDSQTATLPLFGSVPESDVWVFSGSGGVAYIDLPAQYFSIFVSHLGVMAETKKLSQQLKITVGNTECLYDGSEAVNVAVKAPTQSVTITGTNIILADNTEYRLTNVTTLTLNYPTGDFECWMRLSFAESGNITVTLPADTKYIGTAPDFKNGETWELSFKDKILAAQKVGEGT